MKNCVFQYATDDGQIFEDTDLISAAEADVLWNKYIPTFKKHMEDGRNPEMAIWIDMDSRDAFRTTSKHWCAEDMELRNGKLYEVVQVG